VLRVGGLHPILRRRGGGGERKDSRSLHQPLTFFLQIAKRGEKKEKRACRSRRSRKGDLLTSSGVRSGGRKKKKRSHIGFVKYVSIALQSRLCVSRRNGWMGKGGGGRGSSLATPAPSRWFRRSGFQRHNGGEKKKKKRRKRDVAAAPGRRIAWQKL